MSATIDARWAPAAQYVDVSSSSAAAEMRHDIDATDFSAHRRNNYYDPRYVSSSSTTAHDNSAHAAAAYRAGSSSSSLVNNYNNNHNNKYSSAATPVAVDAAASHNPRTRSRSAFGASIPPPPSWDDEPLPSAYAQASAQALRDRTAAAAAVVDYDDRRLPASPTRRTKTAGPTAGNVGFPVATNGYAYGANVNGHGYSSSAHGHGQGGDDDADAYSYSYHCAQSGGASSAGSPQRSPTRPSHTTPAPRLTQSASTPVTGGLSRADAGDSDDSYGSARSRTTSRDYNHNNNSNSGIHTPRSRIPTRPRAYSASTASDYHYQETLTDHPPVPPLPPSSSTSQPSQSFPQPPPSPSQSSTMSVSSRAAPDPPHRLVSGGAGGAGGSGSGAASSAAAAASSGIPVLKTRARSMARAPSPDLLANGEMLSDEKPPFRVDLDAALAEIEDELEVRAIQRFAYARPSATGSSRAPRKMSNSSPPLGHQSTGSTGSSPGTSTLTSSTSSFTPSLPVASNRQLRAKAKSISSKNGVTASGIPRPRTPNSSALGRNGTLDRGDLSASQASATSTTTVNGRKRHGSDSVSNNASTPAATRQRKQSTTTPKARAAAAARAATASPPSSVLTPAAGSTSTPAASRLGVAAHLIPPENDFTPPKGADWDDVVLPTVAKKLGISVVHNIPPQDAASDDHLAVEWDKVGTPIRWEKRPRVANGLATADLNSRPQQVQYGFSPTYGDEYESSSTPVESPTRPPANGGADVAPLRTSAGKPTTLASPSFPQPLPHQPAQQNAGQFVPPPQPQQDRFKPPADFVPPPVFQAPAQHGSGKKKGRKDGGGDDIGKGGCACVIM